MYAAYCVVSLYVCVCSLIRWLQQCIFRYTLHPSVFPNLLCCRHGMHAAIVKDIPAGQCMLDKNVQKVRFVPNKLGNWSLTFFLFAMHINQLFNTRRFIPYAFQISNLSVPNHLLIFNLESFCYVPSLSPPLCCLWSIWWPPTKQLITNFAA